MLGRSLSAVAFDAALAATAQAPICAARARLNPLQAIINILYLFPLVILDF